MTTDPVLIATCPLYCASLTSPVSNTSILGIPDTSLAENIVPVKESTTENNCPLAPETSNFAIGAAVPIPTLPVLGLITKLLVV